MYNHYNHYNHNITTITTTTTTAAAAGDNEVFYRNLKWAYAGLNYSKSKNGWNLQRIRDEILAHINKNAVSVCVVMLLYFYD